MKAQKLIELLMQIPPSQEVLLGRASGEMLDLGDITHISFMRFNDDPDLGDEQVAVLSCEDLSYENMSKISLN